MSDRAWWLPVLLAGVLLAGCGRDDREAPTDVEEVLVGEEVVEEEPTPTPTPEPTPEPIDTTAQVTVLGYHRFENPAHDALAITTEEFRSQMQALKDNEIEVISMDDFLAWRRGERNIPARSAIITIDDGYNCGYTQAWPVLQEFGYPFTMYVYTNYISAGGRSITWEQLEEMRDAGVDIASHSVSHDNLARPRQAKNRGRDYDEWLWEELKGSKDILEQRLGIAVTTFTYPYGIHNANIMEKGLEAGYEALFTVNGQKATFDTPAAAIGRYIIDSKAPEVFRNAIRFPQTAAPTVAAGAAGGTGGPAPRIPTTPGHNETISDPHPEITAELSSLGTIDPSSVEMRMSGFGVVPAEYDAETQVVSYRPTQRLREPNISVIVSARADGRRVETRWDFAFDPNAAPAAPAETPAGDQAAGAEAPAD